MRTKTAIEIGGIALILLVFVSTLPGSLQAEKDYKTFCSSPELDRVLVSVHIKKGDIRKKFTLDKKQDLEIFFSIVRNSIEQSSKEAKQYEYTIDSMFIQNSGNSISVRFYVDFHSHFLNMVFTSRGNSISLFYVDRDHAFFDILDRNLK